jgi:pimeloyl-ACP methyl ester carboxylesterase
MVVMNVPHSTVMKKHLRSNFAQIKKSWYIFFFQLPGLPELFSRMDDWRIPAHALLRSSRPGTFSEDDLARYKQAWAQPGAYTAMLNWYRAMIRRATAARYGPRIKVPTLLIWGTGDKFLGKEMAEESIDLCDQGQLQFFKQASHWVQHEEPGKVNALILDFFDGR